MWIREVPRPDVDVDEARRALCRRHVHNFGPTSPKAFAWWSGLAPADALSVWNSIRPDLLEVDFEGAPAWILKSDEQSLRAVTPPRGTRLLVASDLRLFGRDRDARFIAPGLRSLTPAADSFHPNGLVADGKIIGAWGRKGGHVDVILTEPLSPRQQDELAAEISTLPIAEPRLSIV